MIQFNINLNLSDAKAFADLSGDFNPMHLEEQYSRRLIYGEPVAHGINVILKILENRFHDLDEKISINHLIIKFLEPVYYNKIYTCFVFKVGEKENIILKYNQKKIIDISISYAFNSKFKYINLTNNIFQKIIPNSSSIDNAYNYCDSIDYKVDTTLFKLIYPIIYNCISFKFINFLISTSYIVGMRMPGLNSIYSQIELNLINDDNSKINKISINLHKIYKSVNLIKLDISDSSYLARINCFFRPPPINQPKIKDLTNLVSKDEFKSQNALIIGGSRGLGELTAKILALGSGKVTITYSSGIIEATRIKDEIYDFNKSNLSIKKLNVHDEIYDSFLDNFTHIYYFATPKIKQSDSKIFDQKLYLNYYNYYIFSFNRILESFSKKHKCKIFYPSTIFIEQEDSFFREYVKAKIDGEKLIENFDKKNIKIFKPRLPKLETDQTASLIYEKKSDTISIMHEAIKQFSHYE